MLAVGRPFTGRPANFAEAAEQLERLKGKLQAFRLLNPLPATATAAEVAARTNEILAMLKGITQ